MHSNCIACKDHHHHLSTWWMLNCSKHVLTFANPWISGLQTSLLKWVMIASTAHSNSVMPCLPTHSQSPHGECGMWCDTHCTQHCCDDTRRHTPALLTLFKAFNVHLGCKTIMAKSTHLSPSSSEHTMISETFQTCIDPCKSMIIWMAKVIASKRVTIFSNALRTPVMLRMETHSQ